MKVTPIGAYLVLAPLLYLAFALITPPFQTPDEHQHLFRAYQLSSFQLKGERNGSQSGGGLPPSLVRAATSELGTAEPHAVKAMPKTTFTERLTQSTPLNSNEEPRFANFLGSATYSPIGYGPQIVAIWIGRALDLPVEVILRLGRIFNAALTLGLFCLTFRFLPVGHWACFLIALTPMTSACASSFGQDGLIIGGSALLTALSVKTVLQGRWTTGRIWSSGILTCVVTLSKFVYFPIAGLALVPPSSRPTFLRWIAPPVVFGLIAASMLAAWLRANADLVVPMMPGMPHPGTQLEYIAADPSVFANIFIRTYRVESGELLRTLFTFGWLNVGPVKPALFATFLAFLMMLYKGDPYASRLSLTWRAWALVVSLAVVALLTLALYLGATPLGAASVKGLQGRYFLPLALPISLALLRSRSGKTETSTIFMIGCMLMANIASLWAIRSAYYI